MSQAKILIVEDEMLVAEDIAGRLSRLGYQVTALVESGEEAIAEVNHNPPDLVLMDIVLAGDLDGIDTAKMIRQSHHIPVVYLTAYGDRKTLNRSKTTEPFGYIVKPFDERQLEITIEIALNKYQAEDRLRQSLSEVQTERTVAEETIRVKNQYISMVSHELRQPISTILLSAETLELSQEKFNRHKTTQYLQFIQDAAENLDNMVADLLFLGRWDSGKVKVDPEMVHLETFCNLLIDQLQVNPGRNDRILLAIAPDTPTHVWLDQKLLTHILMNLLSNAIKYSPDGGKICLVIYVEPTDELSNDLNTLILQVQDGGIGIPKKDMKQLFDSFHRCSNVKSIEGNGLGLSIVKKAVELQQGTIAVESEEGVGTTFTVSLPLV